MNDGNGGGVSEGRGLVRINGRFEGRFELES